MPDTQHTFDEFVSLYDILLVPVPIVPGGYMGLGDTNYWTSATFTLLLLKHIIVIIIFFLQNITVLDKPL